MLCLRFAALVRLCRRIPHGYRSASRARLDTGGWLALARQGLSPCKKRQASLDAPTTELSGAAGKPSHGAKTQPRVRLSAGMGGLCWRNRQGLHGFCFFLFTHSAQYGLRLLWPWNGRLGMIYTIDALRSSAHSTRVFGTNRRGARLTTLRPDVRPLSLRASQIASMLLLYRATMTRPLFRTSSTIASFFIVVISKFFG